MRVSQGHFVTAESDSRPVYRLPRLKAVLFAVATTLVIAWLGTASFRDAEHAAQGGRTVNSSPFLASAFAGPPPVADGARPKLEFAGRTQATEGRRALLTSIVLH